MVSVLGVVDEFMFCKNLENLLEDGEESPLFPLPAVG